MGKLLRSVYSYLKLAVIFTTIFFSISSASILVLLSGASAAACAFWRVLIAALILWIFHLLQEGRKSFLGDKRIWGYSIVSGIFLAIHFVLWMESLFRIPVAVSTTIVVTYPLFSIIVDWFLLRDRVSFLQVIGLSAGFIGILLFMYPWLSSSYHFVDVLYSLGGALGATGHFIIGRYVRKNTNLLRYTSQAYTSAAVTILLYLLVIPENPLSYPSQTYIYFLLLAIIPMIGGHVLINYLLKFMKTSAATSIALSEPIGASILAYFFLEQRIDFDKIVIMIVILVSIALTISQEIKKADNP